jgi:hypothetical protein
LVKKSRPPRRIKGKRGSRAEAEAAKEDILRLLTEGNTVQEACRLAGRTVGTYHYHRAQDEDFRHRADLIIGRRRREVGGERKPVPEFPEFCEKYLGMKLFWHQLQWYDLLEGREPRDMHPAQLLLPGSDPNMLLVNTPPGHAKSTTITAAYTLWRLMRNPNSQIVIVSKNESMAKKWMFQIQDWMTSRSFAKLQEDFGPAGGFKETSPIWSRTQIYFGPELRDENAKDPTLEVLGMHGTIYGARADLIICDDIIDSTNAHDFDNQIEWLTGMVLTRPADQDKVLIIGTRIAPVDLYKELMNPARYDDDTPPWTRFSTPAVLEFADDPEDWVTLWPRSNIKKKNQIVTPDEDGLYPKWDGPALARMKKRVSTDPYAWPLKYQQEEVVEDAIFPREAVYGCVSKHRQVGRLAPGQVGVPPEGMAGKYVIAGLDPASVGHTAATVVALDRESGKRYVLDAWDKANATPGQVRELMLSWALKYGVQEWRVEKVLLSKWITQDREISRGLTNLGCRLVEHVTTGGRGGTKWDPIAGIMSLSGLFNGWADGWNLIDIPSTTSHVIKALCEQLCTFFPEKKTGTDLLMALWFCEIRCRELMDAGQELTHVESWWDSPLQKAAQFTVDLRELNELDSVPDPIWGVRSGSFVR